MTQGNNATYGGTGGPRVIAGRYSLVRPLGRGGMGTVWQAVDELLRREVAVKEVSLPDDLDDTERELRRTRAIREARAAASVTHPNVVTIYDVVEHDDRPWIVMELVRARSLGEIVDTEGPLPPHDVAQIGIKVLAALRAARAADVLHRDVKPSNILLDPASGRVVLTDFGIATVAGSSTLTATGMLIGSPEYLAPERVLGREPGAPSDVWSLGVTLYQAVEGVSPFRRAMPIETLTAVLQDDVPPARRAGVLVPALGAMLRKDPLARPDEDAAEQMLVTALDPGAEPGTYRFPAVPPPPTPATPVAPVSQAVYGVHGVPQVHGVPTYQQDDCTPWPTASWSPGLDDGTAPLERAAPARSPRPAPRRSRRGYVVAGCGVAAAAGLALWLVPGAIANSGGGRPGGASQDPAARATQGTATTTGTTGTTPPVQEGQGGSTMSTAQSPTPSHTRTHFYSPSPTASHTHSASPSPSTSPSVTPSASPSVSPTVSPSTTGGTTGGTSGGTGGGSTTGGTSGGTTGGYAGTSP